MKKNLLQKGGIVCLSILAIGNLYAQENDSIKKYVLNEVMISATRSEKTLLEVPKSANIITQNEISHSGATNLADLISFYEGVNVVGRDLLPGFNQSYFLRGISSEQSTIMIDGIRLTDPSTVNNAVNLSEISVSDIKQVEIVKGAHSTLYGSSTIGGMINIITRKKMNPGFNARAFLNAGTLGSGSTDFTENLLLNYTFRNNFYVNAEVFNRNVKGLDATLDTITTEGTFKNNDDDDFSKTDLTGRIGYQSKNTDGFISYKYSDNYADIDNGAYDDDENNTLDMKRNMINYNLKQNMGGGFKLWVNGGFSGMERINVNDSSLISPQAYDRNYYKGTFSGNMISNEIQLEYAQDYLTILLGAGTYHETMTSETYTYSGDYNYESRSNLDSLNLNKTLNNIYLSIDANGGFLSKSLSLLSIHGGLRFNNENDGDNYLTYEVNPSVKLGNKGLLYGTVATGFNSPSLYKLYTPEVNFTSGITRGNPKLEAETSTSLELGYKQQIGENLVVMLSAYQNQINNTIQYVYLWDGAIGIDTLGNDWMRDDNRGDTYLNLGKLTTQGIEASIWYNIQGLTLRANLSLQQGSLEFNASDIDPEITGGNHLQLYESGKFLDVNTSLNKLPRRMNTGNIMASYHFKSNTNVSLSARIYGKKNDVYYSYALGPWGAVDLEEVKGFTLIDLKVNQQILPSLSANLSVNNLLNSDYTELLGYRTRGVSVYLGVVFNFNQ